jgi:hypothetical protein
MSDIQQQIESIENQVQIAEAGYQAFRRMFAQTNRPPAKRPYTSRLGLIRMALIVIMIASSIVSASHTIPTFANTNGKEIYEINFMVLAVGIAAFFMSEVALATFAYVGVMRHYRETEQEPKSLKTLVKLGVVIPFLVMAAANINHEFSINGVVLPTAIMTLIILAISLSAPMMGYISGEVFAMFEVIDRVDQEKHDAIYADLQEKWEEKSRQAWGRSKSDYGGRIRVEPVPVHSLVHSVNSVNRANEQSEQNGQMVHMGNSANGYTKRMDAKAVIREYFASHPDHFTMRLDDLVPLIQETTDVKVGRTSIHNVRKEMAQ